MGKGEQRYFLSNALSNPCTASDALRDAAQFVESRVGADAIGGRNVVGGTDFGASAGLGIDGTTGNLD